MIWYQEHLGDWELMDMENFSPEPGVTIYTSHYRKGENGAFIFAISGPQPEGMVMFGIVTGYWSVIEGCGQFGAGGPEGLFDASLPPGAIEFSRSPLPLDSIVYIIPLGNTGPPAHTTPTDHIYFVYGEVTLEVAAPASGKVLRILNFSGTNDQGIMIGVTNSYTYYLFHLHLDEDIKVGDSVEAGRRLGTTAPPSAFDLGVVNANLINPFVNPSRYWETRIHADAPLKYFKEPIRTQLYSKVSTTGANKDGIVCYDQPGKLIGNWWLSDTPPVSMSTENYESYAIAFVYSNYEPDKIVISIGSNFGGAEGLPLGAYRAEGPSPENITPQSGKVTYKLYQYTPGWPPSTGARAGLLIVEMVENDKIKVEAFADTSSDTKEFTSNARIYVR